MFLRVAQIMLRVPSSPPASPMRNDTFLWSEMKENREKELLLSPFLPRWCRELHPPHSVTLTHHPNAMWLYSLYSLWQVEKTEIIDFWIKDFGCNYSRITCFFLVFSLTFSLWWITSNFTNRDATQRRNSWENKANLSTCNPIKRHKYQ